MTSFINASTSSGVVTTADTSGSLALQTASTTALTLDTSQNATFAGSVKTNTLTSAASTNLTLQSAGTTAVTIDTSQNVLVGTTTNSASTKVAILGSSTVNGISVRNGTIAGNYESSDATRTSYWQFGRDNVSTGNFVFTYNGSQQACIDTSGNFLLGTTTRSNDEKFTVYQNAAAMGISVRSLGSTLGNYETSDQNRVNYWTFGRDNAVTGNFVFASNGSQKAAIDTSGNLLVGQTSSSYQNSNSASIGGGAMQINHASGTSSGTAYMGFGYNGSPIGSITQNGTTGVLYNLTSDYRLKNNPVALTGAKDFVMALQPKTWDWWDGSGKGVGFIAHEFMEVAKYSGQGEKDAVDENGKPIHQSIQPSSSEVMANMVALMQEQQALITAQAETINALTARIVALEAK